MLKLATFSQTHTGDVNLTLSDLALHTEYIGTTFVEIVKILMKGNIYLSTEENFKHSSCPLRANFQLSSKNIEGFDARQYSNKL